MVKDFVLSSKVFHKRYFPKQNSFNYRSYYVILNMLKIKEKKPKIFSLNKFNFKINLQNFAKNQIIVNYYDNNKLQLGTAIKGSIRSLSSKNLITEFIRSPLLTLKVVFLIHWQAIKIVVKRIKYISKPIQNEIKIITAEYMN